MAISEIQGWRAIPTQQRKASNILTSILAAFFVQQPPKDILHSQSLEKIKSITTKANMHIQKQKIN